MTNFNLKELPTKINELKKDFEKEVLQVKTPKDLETLKIKYLGRKGFFSELSSLLPQIQNLEERKEIGQAINFLKNSIQARLEEIKNQILQKEKEGFDFTLPGLALETGHLHPLTIFLRKVVKAFQKMGFEVVQGQEIEEEKYNFDLLNIPSWHPARDAWDTFWLKPIYSEGKPLSEKLLLRTHTSPMQLRAMESRQPPVRIIVPGRVFRHEATDPSHETTFYQCEGLAIDRCVRITDLIGTLQAFLQEIFGQIKIRVRPHFYPFVEPGLDIDMSCLICQGKGCPVCKQSGWLEMLGAGMVHPQVLKNMKIDPRLWSGFAFGLGIDRFMMLYFGINDVRLSYSGNLQFVKQF